jgi:hypothetical protein
MSSTFWHTIETTGSAAVDQLKRLIDEGDGRRGPPGYAARLTRR